MMRLSCCESAFGVERSVFRVFMFHFSVCCKRDVIVVCGFGSGWSEVGGEESAIGIFVSSLLCLVLCVLLSVFTLLHAFLW